MSAEDIDNYKMIRKNLDKLKALVEEAELWVQKSPLTREQQKQGASGPRVSDGCEGVRCVSGEGGK